MPKDHFRVARLVSLVASTAVALACGTNYVYSAYAPQLAERLHLSATESNLIGAFGNFGMYLSGIPAGMLVDRRGPRLSIIIGAVALFLGYYPMYLAYEGGKGSMGVPALSFFSAITGIGSCFAFSAAIKAAALNWPRAQRGTATSLPLSAFGLSAFFFSLLSSTLFPGNTGDFLLVLAVGTSLIVLIAFFFIRIVPNAIPPKEANREHSRRLRRSKSHDESHARLLSESAIERNSNDREPSIKVSTNEPGENSSILSYSSSSSGISVYDVEEHARNSTTGESDDSQHTDARGWALLRMVDFWLLYLLLGLLSGVGLMTINNLGHNAQALWAKFDPEKTPEYVQKQQAMHVSILSLCSFSGRIISGISSDILHRSYRAQRLWMITLSGTLFCLAQIAALSISNPLWLAVVSSLSGLAYGVLFGVFPTIISEVFGLHGLSQNWGAFTTASVTTGQLFNLIYGRIYDAHSIILPHGPRECNHGLNCYKDAYWVTLTSSLLGLGVSLGTIARNRKRENKEVGGRI